MSQIKLKRGMKANLPSSLPLGEPAFCLDTKEMYVGQGKGKPLIKVNAQDFKEIDSKFKQTNARVSEIANKGTTVEVLERVTKEEIDRQIADGTLANLTIKDNSITTEKYKDKSITKNKISTVDITQVENLKSKGKYINLFDINGDLLHGYMYDNTGQIIEKSFVCTSNFIQVLPNSVYYKNQKTSGFEVSLFDKNKRFISQFNVGVDGKIVIPKIPSVAYMRLVVVVSHSDASKNILLEDFMVVESDVEPVDYTAFTLLIESENLTENSVKNKHLSDDISILKTVEATVIDEIPKGNLFNYETAKIGLYSTTDGIFSSSVETVYSSDFIPVKPNETYIKNQTAGGKEVSFFDENKNFVLGFDLAGYAGNYENKIVVPNDERIKYMVVCVLFNHATSAEYNMRIEDFMLVHGDVLPLQYLPYYGKKTFELPQLLIPEIDDLVEDNESNKANIKINSNKIKTLENKVNNIGSSNTITGQKPRPILLDTDWWTDSDDAVSIRILNWAEQQGMVDLVGICLDAVRDTSVKSLSTFLDYEGRSGLCLGADKEATDYNGVPSYHQTVINSWNYYDYSSIDELEDCVEYYRRALTSLPSDEQVDIICIGYGNALSRLLNSSADKYSDLSGIELVESKVRHLWFMAGQNLTSDGGLTYKGSENNFTRTQRSRQAGKNICDNWPTPITFLGWEVSSEIRTGGTIGTTIGTSDLIYKILLAHGGTDEATNGRSSWDPMTMLLACVNDDNASGYKYIYGINSVDETTGNNTFTVNPDGKHRFVIKKYPNDWYKYQINNILEKRAWKYRQLGRVQLPKIGTIG